MFPLLAAVAVKWASRSATYGPATVVADIEMMKCLDLCGHNPERIFR